MPSEEEVNRNRRIATKKYTSWWTCLQTATAIVEFDPEMDTVEDVFVRAAKIFEAIIDTDNLDDYIIVSHGEEVRKEQGMKHARRLYGDTPMFNIYDSEIELSSTEEEGSTEEIGYDSGSEMSEDDNEFEKICQVV